MQNTRQHYEERILRVQLYIHRHLDDPLPLNELASVACFSPYHFHRIFKGMTGESVKEHVRRLRLERAAQELRYTTRPVIQIALDAGYQAHESFTRAFSNMFGASPKQFRDNLQSASVAQSDRAFTYRIIRQKGDDMEVKIKEFQAITVAFIRHMGPYEQCGLAWEKLCSNPSVQKKMRPDSEFIGICYDDPDVTDSNNVRMDVCMTVGDDFVSGEGVDKQQIDSGDYAVLIHHGSYDGLHDSYRWLYGEWLPGSGREAQLRPSLEIYHNSPENTAPEDLVTEIRVPLK